MYYHAAYIWLQTRLASNESVYDELTAHFEGLVEHADVFVKAKASENPTFTFEIGAVRQLAYLSK